VHLPHEGVLPSHLIFLFRHVKQAFLYPDWFLRFVVWGPESLVSSSGVKDIFFAEVAELVDAEKRSLDDVFEAIGGGVIDPATIR